MKKIISGIMELNLPNKLTLLRMALVPVYLVLLAYGMNVAALIVFAIASSPMRWMARLRASIT